MPIPRLPRKTWLGLSFIYLAGLGWVFELFIPFIDLPQKLLVFTIVLIVAELSFLVGVALLGKAYYHQLKQLMLQKIRFKRSK